MPDERMGNRALPQPPDVNTSVVLMTLGGFLVFVAVAIGALLLFLKAQAPGAFAPRAEQRFPEPVLQKAPQDDLGRFEAAQDAALSSYGWVDHAHGIARVPIEEAMRMTAARREHAYDPLQDVSPSRGNASGGTP